MSPPTAASIRTQIEKLSLSVTKLMNSNSLNNINRRSLYADAELIRCDIDEHRSSLSNDDSASLHADIDALTSQLSLVAVPPPSSLMYRIDATFRFISITTAFITFGIFLSLPLIALQILDKLLFKLRLLPRGVQIAEKVRKFFGSFF